MQSIQNINLIGTVLAKVSHMKELIKSNMHLTRSFLKVSETRQAYLDKSVEEKRKLYRCKKDFNTLDDIPTWESYFEEENLMKNDGTFRRIRKSKNIYYI
jgi:hypothetical protein